MPRVHKGTEAKGDGQAVQVHGDCLSHVHTPRYKVIHDHTYATVDNLEVPKEQSYTITHVQHLAMLG